MFIFIKGSLALTSSNNSRPWLKGLGVYSYERKIKPITNEAKLLIQTSKLLGRLQPRNSALFRHYNVIVGEQLTLQHKI